MRARLASTVMLSAVVFFVVAMLVSVGVLWWSGDVPVGIAIGGICGAAAAFAFGAVVRAMGRSGDAPATSTSDLGMVTSAEQGMPSRNMILLPYSLNLVERGSKKVALTGFSEGQHYPVHTVFWVNRIEV